MGYAEKHSLALTITSTANTTGYIPGDGNVVISGYLHNIIYHAGSVPFTSNADVTIVVEATSQVVLQTVNLSTGSQVFAPRQVIHTTTGASTAAGGDYFLLAQDRLKVNVVDATTGNTGTFIAIVR